MVKKCPDGWLNFGEAKCVGIPETVLNERTKKLYNFESAMAECQRLNFDSNLASLSNSKNMNSLFDAIRSKFSGMILSYSINLDFRNRQFIDYVCR
jgi:hypothetical protein